MDQEYQKNEKFRELCYIGDMELIKNFYRSNNPDINSQNKVNGWTCLHWACSKNNLNLIQYLCENGANQEIKNKDGKTPIEYIQDKNIQKNLGLNFPNNDNEELTNKSNLIPNFLKNPQFHYANKSLYDSEPIRQNTKIDVDINPNVGQMLDKSPKISKEKITIRVRSNFDEDFIEIDIDKQNLDFEMFKKVCQAELEGINENFRIYKIRKLPNILIRNTNDIKRLQNEQEIEFVFVP